MLVVVDYVFILILKAIKHYSANYKKIRIKKSLSGSLIPRM